MEPTGVPPTTKDVARHAFITVIGAFGARKEGSPILHPRRMRFHDCQSGFVYVEVALTGRGARIVAVEDGELEDDLVRDVTEVMTLLCTRLYSRRSARRRVERAPAAKREA